MPTTVPSAREGPYVAAIRAAAAAFLERNPRADLAEYQLEVCREGDRLHVVFSDQESPLGMRGGGRPGRPGFEVTLQGADLVIAEAHFVR